MTLAGLQMPRSRHQPVCACLVSSSHGGTTGPGFGSGSGSGSGGFGFGAGLERVSPKI